MARAMRFAPFVYAAPDTFGPIFRTFAPDTTSYATLLGGSPTNLVLIQTLANWLRAGFINAGLAAASGSATAAAQSASTFYVKSGVQSGGVFNAALAAFSGAYVQAEWTALRNLVNQMRTCVLNAGMGTATAAYTPYTLPIHTKFVRKDVRLFGTSLAAANAQTGAYVKADVDTIITVMNWLRAGVLISKMGSGSLGAVQVINASPANAVLDLAVTASQTVAITVSSITDLNGFVIAELNLAARVFTVFQTGSENPANGVCTVVRNSNTSYTITGQTSGTARVEIYSPGGTVFTIDVNVQNNAYPVSLLVAPASVTLTIASPTQQLTWNVRNLNVAAIAAYTNSNTFVTFLSAQPGFATVNATGLITRVANGGPFNVTATFTRTLPAPFFGAPSGAAAVTVVLTSVCAVTTTN